MRNRALELLQKAPILHMGMIFPILRGTAEILYADTDAVFLKELESNAYMLSVSEQGKGEALLDSVGEQALYCVHQESAANQLMGKYAGFHCMRCYQAVYTKKAPLPMRGGLDIRALCVQDSALIFRHYNEHVDHDYITRRLERGEIFGGFERGELCGFVGTHEEGSIGILEIFEPYRKRGYGAELESFMANRMLEQGQIPFAQIAEGNDPSIHLQRKLGFELSDRLLYWIIRG